MPKRGQHYTLGIRHGAVTPYPPPPPAVKDNLFVTIFNKRRVFVGTHTSVSLRDWIWLKVV